jgi:hypothetical protein
VRQRGIVWVVLIIVCGCAAPALGQLGAASLTGSVTDTQNAAIPGVTVTARSPALIGGSEVLVTEANGAYRFPSLPPGTYSLTLELAGFQSVTRSNIVLLANQTLTVDAQLQPASVQETVTVTAASPVIDVRTTAVGSVLTADKLVGVPTSTDVWGALAQTAGVRMQGYDVGGSHKMSQTGYESFGIRSQNRVMIEGIDATESTGGDGNYQDYFTQSELVVSAAGGDVAMNAPGAFVSYIVKSGGNQFHGLENLVYEGSRFVSDNIDPATAARGFTGQPNLKFYEGHAELGGPIRQDKVWFYNAYNHFTINKAISGVPQSIATNLGVFNAFDTKETWKATGKDTVIGFFDWNKKDLPLRGLSATVGPDSALAEYNPDWDYAGRWQRVWSNRLYSEVTAGTFGYDFPEVPNVDFHVKPPRLDTTTSVQSGAGWEGTSGPFDLHRNKPQLMASVAYFLPTRRGSHDMKWGLEWLDDRGNNNATGTSGAIRYLDSNGQPSQILLTDVGDPATFGTAWTGPSDRDRRQALYYQDRWNAGQRITFSFGVRYDRQRVYYTSAVHKPVLSDIFPSVTVPGADLLVRNAVAPRLGVSWDPVGGGKWVTKAFYGRYYFNISDSFASADPAGANTRTYVFNDLNHNGLYDGPQELGALLSSTGGASTTVDPNLKLPYTDEVNLSLDHQFWGETSLRVAWVRKMSRNQYATINVLREGNFVVATPRTVSLVNYDPNNPNGTIAGQQELTVYDIPNSLKGRVQNVITNIPDSVGGGAYNYDTLDLSFNKRFPRGLFFESSFDLVWRDELRSNSSSNAPTSTDTIGVGYFQNVYPAVSNRQQSTNWQLHLKGRYAFPYDIGAGINLRVQSGYPFTRLIQVNLPNVGNVNVFQQNIDNNRSDTVSLLDLRAEKAFPVRSSLKFTVMLDLFNALNSNAVTNFNLANGRLFNQINATLDPRTAQIAGRFEF